MQILQQCWNIYHLWRLKATYDLCLSIWKTLDEFILCHLVSSIQIFPNEWCGKMCCDSCHISLHIWKVQRSYSLTRVKHNNLHFIKCNILKYAVCMTTFWKLISLMGCTGLLRKVRQLWVVLSLKNLPSGLVSSLGKCVFSWNQFPRWRNMRGFSILTKHK